MNLHVSVNCIRYFRVYIKNVENKQRCFKTKTNQWVLYFQVKKFDLQSLYGNLSGYIGLFIGYSLFQIPSLLRFVYHFIREQMLTKGQKQFSEKPIIEDSDKKDINKIKTDRITDEELERFDYELTKKFEEFKCFLRVKSEN